MKEKLLQRLEAEARSSTSSVPEIAVMDGTGIAVARPAFSSYANDFYSVAKSFIAAGILVLFDQKKLTPEDRIFPILREFFPDSYDKGWERVTISDCLTHRMGIDRGFLDIDAENQLDFGEDWLRYAFSRVWIDHTPGVDHQYSDGAFYILGRIIEKLSGREASRFLAEHITGPLDFRDNAWARCPQGHAVGGSGYYAAAEDAVKLAWLFVNGGVYQGKRILSPETVELARRRDFGLVHFPGRAIYRKGGLYGQMLLADCEKNLAVAWHSFDTDGISERLANIVLDL